MQHTTQHSERAVERRLARALRGRGGRITRADAVALTGLPATEVEGGLERMLATYRSHLAATERGELLYTFDPALHRRDAEPLRERLTRVGERLWRVFVVAFKVAIVVVMVVYFLFFLALLLGLVVARASGRGDDRDVGRGEGHGLPLWLLFWMLPWDAGPRGAPSSWEQRRRPIAPKRAPRKKAYLQVFDFVFGPPRPAPDPGEQERELLAYLRAHAGRITAPELVALLGCDLERAEEEATRLMCDYDGEPEVSEDGVVIYVFRELRVTTSEGPAPTRWRYAWERTESRPPLTGNTTGANAVITLVNGFNLLAPFWLVPALLERVSAPALGAAALWLQVVPAVFSATVFAVPLGRALARSLREPPRLARNWRRRLLREIFGADGHELSAEALRPLAPAEVARELAASPAEEAPLRRQLDALVVPLEGDVRAGEAEGDALLVFPELRRALAAVAAARRQAPALEAQPGEVVFDSARALPAEGSGAGPAVLEGGGDGERRN